MQQGVVVSSKGPTDSSISKRTDGFKKAVQEFNGSAKSRVKSLCSEKLRSSISHANNHDDEFLANDPIK